MVASDYVIVLHIAPTPPQEAGHDGTPGMLTVILGAAGRPPRSRSTSASSRPRTSTAMWRSNSRAPTPRSPAYLSNPDQDPHLFEASPSVARLLSGAAIVVYNGADYDPWMAKLLAASRSPDRKVIVVADLVHRKPGDNPHLWYDPPTMPAYAKALAAALSERDPAHKSDYDQRLRAFLASLQPLEAKIAELRAQVRRDRRHRDRAGVRLHGGRARLQDAQRALPACGDERHRTARIRRGRVRERSAQTRRPAAVLQQPGDRRRGAAPGADCPAIEGSGGRRDRDRTARQDLSGLDDERARRRRSGTVRHPHRERRRIRGCDAGVRRQDGACRHRPRDPRQRVHRRARARTARARPR